MSHLPLDARAILHYLNELGYRNISAEQLKEFLKGMQPQSEIIKKSKLRTSQQQRILQQQLPTTPTTRNPTTTPTTPGGASAPASAEAGAKAASTTTATIQQDSFKRGGGPSVKVIKCKKPLYHFKFYLDICDHQLTKRIEDQIKLLGGALEFFLTPSVTHFVTDKPTITTAVNTHSNIANSCPGTPQTPQTPQTPYSLENLEYSKGPNNGNATSVPSKKPIRNSRADAILNRARRLSTAATCTTPTTTTVGNYNTRTRLSIAFDQSVTTPLKSIDNVVPSPPYVVWSCENALKFFKKVQHELRDYLVDSPKGSLQKTYTVEPISLKGGFIKIEAVKRNYRPYYQLFKKPNGEWPRIELTREDGAFRLSPKKVITTTAATTSPKENRKKEKCGDTAAADTTAAIANIQLKEVNMTRKSRSRSTQNLKKPQENDIIKSPINSQKNSVCKNQVPQKDSTDKQCGVCEICKIEYDALTIHLKTKDHEYFAKNSQNFIALDTLIHSSADVSKFLDENHKLELKTELEEMEVDQEELVNNDEVDPLHEEVVGDAAVDDELGKSCSFNKSKGGASQPKTCSPTLREKSKRSTKGKHSSEKFKNASTACISAATDTAHSTLHNKSPKTASPTKSTASLQPLNVKTPGIRKKHSGASANAALSPPIRAMLPPNSLYKVETHTEVQCTPTKNRIGAGENNAVVASPSIIVKFKKVRHAELQLLNGEAENFMFPKKTPDSSDLPTDIDRHTSSERAQNTASIGTTSPSPSSQSGSPSASDEENDDEYEICQKNKVITNGKKAIAKARRKLPPCKVVVTTTPVKLDGGRYTYPKTPPPKISTTTTANKWVDGGGRQSFPKTPIQPFEQLKKFNDKRNSTTVAVASNPVDILAETAKIMFPEATRKSSRTATAIVTAATTSTRLMQAAVDAAKHKNKVQLFAASTTTITPSKAIANGSSKVTSCQKISNKMLKQQGIKMEISEKLKPAPASKKRENVFVGPASRKLRLSHTQSVVRHVEDRMGENVSIKSRKKRKNKSHTIPCYKKQKEQKDPVEEEEEEECSEHDDKYNVEVKVENDDDDDEDDDDITVDNDDEKDEDYVHRIKPKSDPQKLVLSPSKIQLRTTPMDTRTKAGTSLDSSSKRDERLARRQSRVIAQIKLELHTDLEREEEEQELIMTPKNEKAPANRTAKSPAKAPAKSPPKPTPKTVSKKVSTATSPSKQSHLKLELPPPSSSPSKRQKPSSNKQEKTSQLSPSRLFDYTKSDRLKKLRYAFERLPSSDLWYQVYQRQDNCKEKYFEYFGSTKYRKLPYELGPVPFEMSLQDSMGKKVCCKLCQIKDAARQETETKQKAARKDLFLNLKPEREPEREENNCSSTSATALQLEHSKSLNTSASDSTQQQYAHKHKKLHLLQRYRQEQQQEQQELLQRQKLEEQVQSSNNHRICGAQNNIKTEEITQDSVRSREDRAGSTHSNISSCASSAGTYSKSKVMHKKLLNKTGFMAHLELPPRKSPREHASTLALVSCIIKQRQDSMSKPNSETDESPLTPIEDKSISLPATAAGGDNSVGKQEEMDITKALARLKTPPPSQPINKSQKSESESPTPQASTAVATNSPRTRSHAATPVEELRFATEISENVKRMRRGRNKYDYSPPFVARSASARSSKNQVDIKKATITLWGGSRHSTGNKNSTLSRHRSQTPNAIRKNNIRGRVIPSINSATRTATKQRGRQRNGGGNKADKNVSPLVRKTGTKKGVLEFDMNNTALDSLQKVTMEYKNPKLLEWQIDTFLSHVGKAFHPNEDDFVSIEDTMTCTSPPQNQNPDDDGNYGNICQSLPPPPCSIPNAIMLNTPPATDYFSSDFDLYDLIQSETHNNARDTPENVHLKDQRSSKFSIFNSAHMQGYYRKRKNLKSNRTGWPKVPRKKAATRQQCKNKIYFLQSGGDAKKEVDNEMSYNEIVVKQEIEQEEIADDTTQDQTRESGVITPPDSEVDIPVEENGSASRRPVPENVNEILMGDDDEEEEDEVQGEGLGGSQEGNNEESQSAHYVCDEEDDDEDEVDNDTLADSIEEEIVNHSKPVDSDTDIEAEEDDDKEREDDFDEDLEDSQDLVECKKVLKKSKRSVAKTSFPPNEDDEDSYEPREKRLRCLDDVSILSPMEKSRSNLLGINTATTSTPTTTPFMRAMRRTPQLNGSLGSCISPSEKAGDNSDIFTVSSDGLDTDLDLSNSHSQPRNAGGDDDNHQLHHHHHNHQHDHTAHSGGLNSNSSTTPKRKFDISKYAPTNAASCAAEAATAAVKSLAISQFLKKEVRVQCRRLRAPFRRFRYRR